MNVASLTEQPSILKSAALLPPRLSLGSSMVVHGLRKLRKEGTEQTAGFFEQVGLKPARPLVLATGITAWLCLQAFLNIAVVVQLIPITGITLPFVSDGGSSLIISFAAVGILLSISRETLPRGTWNDADTHSRRGYGRPHLPRAGGAAMPRRPAR